MISVDPHDSTINDLASIKTGIALELAKASLIEINVQPSKFNITAHDHILTQSELKDLLVHIEIIMGMVFRYLRSDAISNSSFMQNNTSSYQLMGKDSELVEDDVISYALEKVFAVLDQFDAGGKPLSSIFLDKNRLFSLNVWITVFEI